MKESRTTLIVALVVVCALALPSQAQDYHTTQFDAIPMMLNPGLSGMTHGEDYRAATLYRSQWRPLAARPFATFALGYDMRIKDRWGVGGYIINSDGAKIFNSFNLVLAGAYEITEPSQSQHELTVGIQAGFIYRNTNDKELTYDNQYSNGEFDASLPSFEHFNRFSKVMPEFSLGMSYKMIDEAQQIRPYGGMSIWHLTSPKVAFVEGTQDESRLPRRFVFNAGSEFQVDDNLMFDVKLLTMFQGQASEILGGFNTYYTITSDADAIAELGLYYRNKDAFIISTGVEYKNMKYVMSYDMTISDLGNYNKRFGALEFTLVYLPK